MAEHMKAWRLLSPQPVDKGLKLFDDLPKPSAESLRDGQVLVSVVSVGLNPADYKVAAGGFAARAILPFPKTVGMDLSGRVLTVGPGVDDVKPGDVVLGRLDPLKPPGSLAEFAVLDRDGYAVLPSDYDLDEAGGAGTVALTAYQSIAPYVKAGDQVFLNGGSGGAGTFGIQICKALGCQVTVTCSTGKVDLCRRLGADDIIDYKTSDVIAELKKKGQVFDHAVDNVGSSPPNLYQSCHHFLKSGAKFVFVGGSVTLASGLSLGKSLALPHFLGGAGRKFVFYLTKNNHEDLQQIAKWLVEGKVDPVIESTFKFGEAVEAYAHLKKGSATGKVIVRVSG